MSFEDCIVQKEIVDCYLEQKKLSFSLETFFYNDITKELQDLISLNYTIMKNRYAVPHIKDWYVMNSLWCILMQFYKSVWWVFVVWSVYIFGW